MKKNIIIGLVSLIVLVGALTLRTLLAAGAFKSLEPHSPFEEKVLQGMIGAEDITFDYETGLALVSSCDRRRELAGLPTKGAIYSLDISVEPPAIKDLTADFNQDDFLPHGISLFRDPADGTKWLFVVNHRRDGHFVEIFQWMDGSGSGGSGGGSGSVLVHRESIGSEHFVSPNDVVGVGKRQFYFTNDHDSHGGVSQLKDFLLIGTGQVGYFDGERTQILAEGIRYANGINISPDRKFLYVAACTAGKILVYQRSPFMKVNEIDCGTGIDNLEIDEEGNIWTAAHPKMLAFLGHAKDPLKRSPSQILKITLSGGSELLRIEEIYLSDGNPLSGSSVAAVFGNHLLMGTVFDDGVLWGRWQ